jgi:hypothetical protein
VRQCRFAGTGRVNPLQDLVNNLANGSAASRTAGSGQRGVDRYAGNPTLASLQLGDDQVNTGSGQPSPGARCESTLPLRRASHMDADVASTAIARRC